jgi:hypothetical protein
MLPGAYPLRHARRPRLVITDEALDLYRRMREIKCTCPPRPESMAYYDAPPECDACLEWALLNRELARLVQLPLYEVHVVPPPSGECFLREPEESRRAAFEEALATRENKT